MEHNLEYSPSLSSCCRGNDLAYLPFLNRDNKLTVVCIQWFDVYDYDESRFIRNKEGYFIYSENEEDIIKFITDSDLFDNKDLSDEYKKVAIVNSFNGKI